MPGTASRGSRAGFLRLRTAKVAVRPGLETWRQASVRIRVTDFTVPSGGRLVHWLRHPETAHRTPSPTSFNTNQMKGCSRSSSSSRAPGPPVPIGGPGLASDQVQSPSGVHALQSPLSKENDTFRVRGRRCSCRAQRGLSPPRAQVLEPASPRPAGSPEHRVLTRCVAAPPEGPAAAGGPSPAPRGHPRSRPPRCHPPPPRRPSVLLSLPFPRVYFLGPWPYSGLPQPLRNAVPSLGRVPFISGLLSVPSPPSISSRPRGPSRPAPPPAGWVAARGPLPSSGRLGPVTPSSLPRLTLVAFRRAPPGPAPRL